MATEGIAIACAICKSKIESPTIKEVAPGKLTGEIDVRNKHRATVEINYDKNNYSIVYVKSVGLESDGTTIHQNYNRWVANLEKAINANLINIQ